MLFSRLRIPCNVTIATLQHYYTMYAIIQIVKYINFYKNNPLPLTRYKKCILPFTVEINL